jgi:hypothetical protein
MAYNPERAREYHHQYHEDHREHLNEYSRQYRETHAEELHEQQRQYRETHHEQIREAQRQWKETHREQEREKRQQRDGELRATILRRYGTACSCPGCGSTKRLSIDHIKGGGRAHLKAIGVKPGITFYRWLYLQYLPPGFITMCGSCNASKGEGERCRLNHRTDYDDKRAAAGSGGNGLPAAPARREIKEK